MFGCSLPLKYGTCFDLTATSELKIKLNTFDMASVVKIKSPAGAHDEFKHYCQGEYIP